MDTPTPDSTTPQTIFQKYNRDEILAGIKCSSNWSHPSQVLNNLFDSNISTKWISYYEGNNLSVTIFLRSQVRITGYGFRSADDCPGRDPRKWDVKFYLPKSNNPQDGQNFSETHIFEGVETPDWPDRY